MAIDLLIDVSWSMNGKPLLDAKSACTYMISRVVNLSVHQMGVTTFSNNGNSICKITSDMRSLLNCLDSMVADSGTNMMDGIDTSYQKLLKSELPEKIIILMTDGEPNRNDRSEVIAAKIRRDNNVRHAVIFIGSSSSGGYTIAQNVAAANAKAGETPLFYTAKSMSELGKIFQRVYTDITTRN